MEKTNNRRTVMWAVVVLAVADIPQWFSCVWSLFTNTPFVQWLQQKGFSVRMPHFSLLWITWPIGLLLLAYIAWQSLRQRRKSGHEPASFQPDDQTRQMFTVIVDRIRSQRSARSGDINRDYYRNLQPVNPLAELIKSANEIKTGDQLEWLCDEFEKNNYVHPLKFYQSIMGDDFQWLPVLKEARFRPEEIKLETQFIDFLVASWSGKERWKEAMRRKNTAPIMPEHINAPLVIHSVDWWIEDKHSDVAKIVRSYLIDSKIEMPCEISILGDPRPNLGKILTIDYSIGSKRAQKAFKEHDIITPQDLK